jgi:hypothetical protein
MRGIAEEAARVQGQSPPAARPDLLIGSSGVQVLRVWVALGVLLSLTTCVAVAASWIVLGSFEGQWVYGYEYGQSLTVRTFLTFLLVSVASGALLRFTVPQPTAVRRDWAIILMWLAAGLALQVMLRSATPFDVETLFVSDTANSFYGFSQQYDAGDLITRFNRVGPQAPWHARGNMPGKVMLMYALRLATSRTDVLPWLAVMVSNLGAVFVYLFVRELFADRKAALYSSVLYLFVPAKLLFFPLMNTVTPVFALASACILLRWLATGRWQWAVALGITLYLLVFFEPLPLVMGLLFAALSLRAITIGQISWRRYTAQTLVVVSTFFASAEAVHITTNFDLLQALRQTSAHAVEFNATEGRPYGVWVLGNLEEFLFGIGPCQAVLFAGALLSGLRGHAAWRSSLTQPITTLCGGLLAVLLAVDLMGINRGEVIRLWIFLACFFQIPAAWVCARLDGAAAITLVVSASALLVALATSMIRFVVP